MIDRLDYALPFVILFLCGVYSSVRAARTRGQGWLILAFFYFCFSLGNLYWLLCNILLGSIPEVSYISELSWYVGFIFLSMLLRQTLDGPPSGSRRWAWLAPVFTGGACLFFFQWGDYTSNVAAAALLGWLGYLILTGLLDGKVSPGVRRLYLVCGAFFVAEYGMWFSSCFWRDESLRNPYFWFDGLLTLSCVLLIPAYGKAVAE